MSGETNLIEVSEFNQRVLEELQAGGPHAEALIDFLKNEFECDYSDLATLLALPSMRVAATSLIEKSTPSAYRKRLISRAYINADSLENGRTNQWLNGPASNAAYAASTKLLAFSVNEGDTEDIYSDHTDSAFTVRNGGAYRISFNGLLNGFAHESAGTQLNIAGGTSHRFTADAGVTGMPVDVIMKVASGASTYHVTLASIMFYPTDFQNFRARAIGGDVTLRLLSSSVVTIYLQRRAKQGSYLGLANSINYPEAIGFNKNTVTLPGMSVPTRDGFNYLEVIRLT